MSAAFKRHLGHLAIGAGLILAILVYNAIPGRTVPGLGQPLWVTTFAQSIANQNLLALTSNNTGAPLPAPMAFGLPGAYSLALLLRVGMAAPTAYALMCAAWLALAYVGAIRLAVRIGLTPTRGALLATVWLCLPMIWGHAGYSMLSIGFALLPAYLVPVFDAGQPNTRQGIRRRALIALRLLIVGTIAAFMDGYTFVMYAFASMAWLASSIFADWRARRTKQWWSILAQAGALIVAASLYRLYIGGAGYWIAPLSAFRGWGIDLAFLVQPTSGTSWLGDLLHVGQHRDIDLWFGDRSVWDTTFALPLLLASVIAWQTAVSREGWRMAALAMLVFGVYMSLGPSLKAWSRRTDATVMADGNPRFMPESAARMPTGSGWASAHLPALNSMRAPYRWLGLGMLGMWLVLALSQRQGKSSRAAHVATWIVLLVSLPPPSVRFADGRGYHAMWHQVDHDVLKPFRKEVPPGSLVVGLPYNNDFLLGYLAAKSRVRTYNTGGDKNIALAAPHWPAPMRELEPGQFPVNLLDTAERLFISDAATALMIPLYQEPIASHAWPCLPVAEMEVSDEDDAPTNRCPAAIAQNVEHLLGPFNGIPGFRIVHTPSFILISPEPDFRDPRKRDERLAARLTAPPVYPLTPADMTQGVASQALLAGWSPVESDHVWSSDQAKLRLPLPRDCQTRTCTIKLVFHTYAASQLHPKDVTLRADNATVTESIRDDSFHDITIPLSGPSKLATVGIEVHGATSPYAQGESEDRRVLGIALFRVEVGFAAAPQ
ncbi:hypothetical protein [Luteibacter sp. SG786]|uniref:hypothetical protein n=1 Tax=Luteibacter sp. SG786 TaxID=2587130 RepID=UPI001420747A|nr:hypothetical protein [Luteibacter sp. SG786]NII56429.1 hypothetical protein [Luteibacter sp. SG786]